VDSEVKKLKRVLLIAAGLAVLFACGVLWIALSHNPQQEFYGSEIGVNWRGIVTLWGMSFVVAFAILVVSTSGVVRVFRYLAAKKRGNQVDSSKPRRQKRHGGTKK
jgi:ABC-type Mn2+/Zn2+ transport system permease subunit